MAVKKVVYRAIKPLLEPMLAQQRDFNATVIYLLSDLANTAPDRQAGPGTGTGTGAASES